MLDSLIVSGLLRSAGLKVTGLPPLSGILIRLSFMADLGLLRSKELLSLLFWSGGCWYLDFDTVLTVDPFANLKLFLIRLQRSLFIFFFVTWFRARMRVRWVGPVISVWFVRID